MIGSAINGTLRIHRKHELTQLDLIVEAKKLMKGGLFLCHDSHCNRYRIGARTSNTIDSASTNLGFRCAKNL